MGEITRWSEICRVNLSLKQLILNLYEESSEMVHVIPLVLRDFLAHFLETRFGFSNAVGNKGKFPCSRIKHKNKINGEHWSFSTFKSQLIEQILTKAPRQENSELFNTTHSLQKLDAEEIFKTIQSVLKTEQEIFTNFQAFSALLFEIRQKIVKLASVPIALSDSEWQIRKEYSDFYLLLTNLKEKKLLKLETAVAQLIETLQQEFELEETFKKLRATLKCVVDKLCEISFDWKLSCISPRSEPASQFYFDFIQTALAEILDVISTLTEFVQSVGFSTFYAHLTSYFAVPELFDHIEKLLRNSLRIKNQPSEIINTSQKSPFSASIYTLSRGANNVKVKRISISFITEEQKRILVKEKQNFPPDLEINNNDVVFEKKEPKKKSGKAAKKSGQSSTPVDFNPVVNFKNGKISFKRHKNGKKVMEGKYYALFHTEIQMPKEGNFEKVWCISTALVFMSNVSQSCDGYGTIFWSNYAHPPSATLSTEAPSHVECHKLKEALNFIFQDMTEASRKLGPDELNYLLKLVCAPLSQEGVEITEDLKIPAAWLFEIQNGRPFSFWTWFYSVMCILKKDRQFRSYWDSWSILGFIERDFSPSSPLIDFLTFSPSAYVGAFFLRFSESELGQISLSYVKKYGDDGSPEIASLLMGQEKSLAWHIHNLDISSPEFSGSGFDFEFGSSAIPYTGKIKNLTNVIQRRWNWQEGKSDWTLVSKEANEAFGSRNNVSQENGPQQGQSGKGSKKPYERIQWLLRILKPDHADQDHAEESQLMEL